MANPAQGTVQQEYVEHLKFDNPALVPGAQPSAEFMECLLGRRNGVGASSPWCTQVGGPKPAAYKDFGSGGTVTYAATTVTDTSKTGAAAWATNQWVNRTVVGIGTNGQLTLLVVTSNTATVITGTGGWSNGTPSAAAFYSVEPYIIGNRIGLKPSWWGNFRQDGNGNSA